MLYDVQDFLEKRGITPWTSLRL